MLMVKHATLAQFLQVGHFYMAVLGHYHVAATGFNWYVWGDRPSD